MAEAAAERPRTGNVAGAGGSGGEGPNVLVVATSGTVDKAPVGELQALGLLAMVALVWGVSAPVFRWIFVMEHPPDVLLILCLANLVALTGMLLRFDFGGSAKDALAGDAAALRGGVETGLLFYLGDVLILGGLTLTTATHAAFISQLCTLLVPCIEALEGRAVTSNIWVACTLAFVGCILVVSDSASVANAAVEANTASTSLYGDLLCLASAVCFALYAIRLQRFTRDADSEALTLWNKVAQAAGSVVCLLAAVQFSPEPGPTGFFAAATPTELALTAAFVLVNGMLNRGLVSLWQADAFKIVSPSKAEVVFASTPLWSLVFAVAFLAEPLGARLVAGIALFLGAMWLAISEHPADEKCKAEA